MLCLVTMMMCWWAKWILASHPSLKRSAPAMLCLVMMMMWQWVLQFTFPLSPLGPTLSSYYLTIVITWHHHTSSVTLSPYHPVTLSSHHIATLSPCHLTTSPHCHLVTSLHHHLITSSTISLPCPFHLVLALSLSLPCPCPLFFLVSVFSLGFPFLDTVFVLLWLPDFYLDPHVSPVFFFSSPFLFLNSYPLASFWAFISTCSFVLNHVFSDIPLSSFPFLYLHHLVCTHLLSSTYILAPVK